MIHRIILAPVFAGLLGAASAIAQPALPSFDFSQPEAARDWIAAHHIASLASGPEGLVINIAGNDPYFHGPLRDYPAGQLLWMTIRLKSDQGGAGQVFYFDTTPKEENSRRFQTAKGEWTEARISLPALGPKCRLRIDPPGDAGQCVLASIRFEPRREFVRPDFPWKKPAPANIRVLAADGLEMFVSDATPLGYEFRINSKSMAFGHPTLRIAYAGKEVVWTSPPSVVCLTSERRFSLTRKWTDPDGGAWSYAQRFSAGKSGVIEVETTVEVDRDREVLFLPMLLLSAGEGSFGTNKNQALFAGLEYLENEPSSSEADIIGQEARRQVPSNHKLTFPLMTIQTGGSYIGLDWDDHRAFSGVFDSPDRLFNSGGHCLGVIWPESDGFNRVEGSLLPQFPRKLKAGQVVQSKIRILGGKGDTVIPAVQHYVQLHGLPPVPKDLPLREYAALAAQGWLKSKIREGNLYRHAVWQGFGAQPAADAGVYQTWLAGHVGDAAIANELHTASKAALEPVKAPQYYHSGVGHIRTPMVPLVFGSVRENIETARTHARNTLRGLGDDFISRYRPSGDRPDYGKTYRTNHANGMTGRAVADALEAAAFCGDRELIEKAVAALRAQARYQNSVPRGAQTWEIPLHTPDILASAHMVNAYVTGYELTGDQEFMREAVYWAWTGVPFVYLVNPTGQKVGPYGTIAVLGATSWQAPVWFGQPVQWCGLVYADALYRLAAIDRAGIWKQLADGITAAGIQHTWKANDAARVGLLPDFYLLQPQRSDGPAINPGTVGINAARLYAQPPMYDFRRFRVAGLNVHAPGEIITTRDDQKTARFQVRGWPKDPYYALVNGLAHTPQITLNGQSVVPQAPHEFDVATGCLILRVSGNPEIQIGTGR